jgi:hypothetical protein
VSAVDVLGLWAREVEGHFVELGRVYAIPVADEEVVAGYGAEGAPDVDYSPAGLGELRSVGRSAVEVLDCAVP